MSELLFDESLCVRPDAVELGLTIAGQIQAKRRECRSSRRTTVTSASRIPSQGQFTDATAYFASLRETAAALTHEDAETFIVKELNLRFDTHVSPLGLGAYALKAGIGISPFLNTVLRCCIAQVFQQTSSQALFIAGGEFDGAEVDLYQFARLNPEQWVGVSF